MRTNYLHVIAVVDVVDGCILITQNGSTEWIPCCPVDLRPAIGMKFWTIGNAISFYAEYAKKGGFDYRLSTSAKDENGYLKTRYCVCSK